jgi:hypothetical protein
MAGLPGGTLVTARWRSLHRAGLIVPCGARTISSGCCAGRRGAGVLWPRGAAGPGWNPAQQGLRQGRHCRRRAATAAHGHWSGSERDPRLRTALSSARVPSAVRTAAPRPGGDPRGCGTARRWHEGRGRRASDAESLAGQRRAWRATRLRPARPIAGSRRDDAGYSGTRRGQADAVRGQDVPGGRVLVGDQREEQVLAAGVAVAGTVGFLAGGSHQPGSDRASARTCVACHVTLRPGNRRARHSQRPAGTFQLCDVHMQALPNRMR